MKKRIVLLSLVFVFMLMSTSFAAIIIDNRSGALKIFMPDDKQIVVQKDESLPDIPDGAMITILGGSATIGTSGKSTVSVSIGTYTVLIKEDSKVDLTLNPDGTMTSTIILGESLITRKGEAYRGPRPPGAPEIRGFEIHEEISPHK